MKPYLSSYLHRVLEIYQERPDFAVHQLTEIFSELEVEIGYLDQKRDEAETNFRAVLTALNEKEKSEELNVSQ
jgi:hypothetical protein